MLLKPIFVIITIIALFLFVFMSSRGSFGLHAAENMYLISGSKDLLSIVSFLLAPFILGLSMQAAAKSTSRTIRYFNISEVLF